MYQQSWMLFRTLDRNQEEGSSSGIRIDPASLTDGGQAHFNPLQIPFHFLTLTSQSRLCLRGFLFSDKTGSTSRPTSLCLV
jgi:hypothetical protein